eukprot:TRINITY_DN12365_c0_g1_i1.p1 TRINITY_DN12365_c0_g1~~TRINITY_DN12365_c0_g1_i1.p1  ORF type:complete len:224 (-),score=31.40 TRINITY_DN12365_c0_g1_i1:520-1191(-)
MMMESRRSQAVLFWIAAVALASFCSGTEAYKNYTISWKSNSSADYVKFASSNNFSLGDYIIFNTDTDHSVIQTYNETVYTNCEADADDSLEYSPGEPTSSVKAATIAVPLVRTGDNFFFSGDYDGQQCKNGMKLHIIVQKGQGLPPSLAPPPPGAPPPEDDDSTPTADLPASVTNPIAAAPDADVSENTSSDTPNHASTTISISFFSAAAALLLALLPIVFYC